MLPHLTRAKLQHSNFLVSLHSTRKKKQVIKKGEPGQTQNSEMVIYSLDLIILEYTYYTIYYYLLLLQFMNKKIKRERECVCIS